MIKTRHTRIRHVMAIYLFNIYIIRYVGRIIKYLHSYIIYYSCKELLYQVFSLILTICKYRVVCDLRSINNLKVIDAGQVHTNYGF